MEWEKWLFCSFTKVSTKICFSPHKFLIRGYFLNTESGNLMSTQQNFSWGLISNLNWSNLAFKPLKFLIKQPPSKPFHCSAHQFEKLHFFISFRYLVFFNTYVLLLLNYRIQTGRTSQFCTPFNSQNIAVMSPSSL